MSYNNSIEEIIEEFQREGPLELSERELKIPTNINKAITIIGLRRVGKTYLLYQTVKNLLNGGIDIDRVFYINFEDERLSGFSAKDFSKVVELFYKKIQRQKKDTCFLMRYRM